MSQDVSLQDAITLEALVSRQIDEMQLALDVLRVPPVIAGAMWRAVSRYALSRFAECETVGQEGS